MKNSSLFKKGVAGVIAATLVFGVSVAPALAGPGDPPSGTVLTSEITGANFLDGKYKVYKIMSGTFTEGSTKIGNALVTKEFKQALIDAINEDTNLGNIDTTGKSDVAVANDISTELAKLKADQQKANDFANKLAAKLEGIAATSEVTVAGGNFSLKNLEQGYYAIIADKASFKTNTMMTSALLKAVGPGTTSFELKTSVPTLTKKTEGNEKSIGVANNKGDKNPSYTLTATLPSNINDFKTYKMVFKDTLPAGLDVTKDELDTKWQVSIKAGDKDIKANAVSAVTAGDANNSVITWTIDDLKAAIGGTIDNSTVVEVKYTPVFDEQDITRIFGKASTTPITLTNKADLTFSNNPYGDGESTTPGTEVKVTSFQLKVLKVKGNGDAATPLKGATFKLTNAAGETAGKAVTTDNNGTFEFTALKAGETYTLTETKSPDGFKSIDPIKFTINPTYDESNTVTAIEVAKDEDKSGAASIADDDASLVTMTVVNVEGADLPLTGQQGITLALIAGLALIGGSTFVVARNRKEEEQA